MAGAWSGVVRCGRETVKVNLKFDVEDPKREGRAFIRYAIEGGSFRGRTGSYILSPTEKEGVFSLRDEGGKLPPLQFEARGRLLTARGRLFTARPAAAATQALARPIDGRIPIDGQGVPRPSPAPGRAETPCGERSRAGGRA